MFAGLRQQKQQANADGDGSYRHGNRHFIELQAIIKNYQTPAGDFPALKGIDFAVDKGEFVAVIGKSGSGKSTLINMITGIDRPTSGRVLIGDTDLADLREGALAPWRGKNIGIVFQFFQLLPTIRIIDNVMLPMDFCDTYRGRARKERALHLLDQVGIAEHAYKLPSEVSGGQQQRVAIARALANDPLLLVADEPTGNLDSKTANEIFDLFEVLIDQGTTMIMVTHDQDLAKRVSRTIVLADGRIIDEYLADAFPLLHEDLLLYAMEKLETLHYAPGEAILQEGDAPEHFYLITKGHVEVLVKDLRGNDVTAAILGPGQYFGEIELLRGGSNRATLIASPAGEVELAALDGDVFAELLGENGEVRDRFTQIVEERLDENQANRTGDA
ncbi:MAG: ATP-binding cassette domain-containing protein [Caldilineaceae bacterium]|nr:ATP-binding cassette domain-containing protein [Caldilineaceae bacterium]